MRVAPRPFGAAPCAAFLLTLPLAAAPQEDDELRRAWSTLPPEAKAELTQRFRAEVAELDTLQSRALKSALALGEADPASYPEAEPYAFYDPQTHAPALAIARERLKPDGGVVRRAREAMFAKYGERRLRTAWRYEWGTRRVVRTADPSDPEHVFENGLAGHLPGVDLAEALLEAALDDGSRQRVLFAFGHAYTDRDGGVYPLTLYDAWCSGETMEMPDIDNLGIVHDLLEDWTTWVSPIPESGQKSLYRKVGSLFEPARRHRALRTALARTFLTGDADMRDGFAPRIDHFHGFWHRHESSPEKGRAALPHPADEEFFMADWGLEVEEDEELRTAAKERRLQLRRDALGVRKVLEELVGELAVGSDGE